MTANPAVHLNELTGRYLFELLTRALQHDAEAGIVTNGNKVRFNRPDGL